MKNDLKGSKQTTGLHPFLDGARFTEKSIAVDKNNPALQKKKREAEALLKSNTLRK